MPSRVAIMPNSLASQVAAGEVVERPASVVKELVENSLDAAAREVTVEMQRGGVAFLKVTDDGRGMSREDALLSLERHATSKLRKKEELPTIQTLGFRGEALPSIASVSRFRMTTREAEAVSGTEIVVDGGTLRDAREAGCPPGTAVEVRDLFFNVPARRKFLKSESTEAAHVDHQVRLHALASPETRFVFRKDGRTLLDVPGTPDRRVRIGDLFGRELLAKLREIPLVERPGHAMSGYILPASEARASRRSQYVMLNGRPIDDAVVWRALAEAFRGALPAGRHPVGWLWLEMDPLLVDVNVHPAKREVRFHRPAELRALVMEAVEMALRSQRPESRDEIQTEPKEMAVPLESTAESAPVAVEAPPKPRTWQTETQEELPEEVVTEPSRPALRIIGALTGRYVVLEASDGLVLLDPRAARERILYERFLQNADAGTVESQGLLVPVLVELDARDADVVVRNAENFREAGMEVESFGGVTMQLRGVPGMLSGADAKALLLDLVDALVDSEGGTRGKALTFEKFAARLARVGGKGEPCRSEAAGSLLDQLFACDLPYCTPDGRPTLVQLSDQELARKFGR